MGIVERRRGSVTFDGRETIGLPSDVIARLGIAYCPEERGIFSSLNVEENLMLPPVVKRGRHEPDEIYELFPNLRSAAAARAPSCRAASSRCWRSAASCAPAPTCCCSTSRPRASRR